MGERTSCREMYIETEIVARAPGLADQLYCTRVRDERTIGGFSADVRRVCGASAADIVPGRMTLGSGPRMMTYITGRGGP